MDPALVRTSRFLSLVLRHRPQVIGIELDDAGWVDIDELLAALARAGRPVELAELTAVVELNDKQRFVMRDGRIRASQGHSVDVELGLDPLEPPQLLFHGTADRHLDSIRASGLRPRRRRHVHLSPDAETARSVGARHGRPVILRVRAGAMYAAGHVFHCSENGVWLTAAVPVEFLEEPSP